jgi:hypothetical protein
MSFCARSTHQSKWRCAAISPNAVFLEFKDSVFELESSIAQSLSGARYLVEST